MSQNTFNTTKFFALLLVALTPQFSYAADRACQNQPIMQTFNQLLLTYETKDRTIKVDLGHGKIVDARLSVTSKGNGGLKLLNLYLRAVDIHDNGRYYEHSLLNVCLDDINGDNHKDIILYGTTLHTGEKEQDPVSKEEVLFIYTYQVTTGKFTETLRNSSFNINTN